MLGCRLGADAAPSPALRRRVERGTALFQAGAAPLLLLSGGGYGEIAEACAMVDLARAAGVPEAALLVETRSRDTLENARECARLLRERGLSRVLLVSDRTHLPRARLLFRIAGLEVVGCAAAGTRSLAKATLSAAREIASLPMSLIRALVGLA